MPVITKTAYEPVPAGTYLLRINDCELQTNSQDRSKTYLRWKFEILNDCPDQGREIGILTPSEIRVGSSVEKILLACGCPPLEIGQGTNTDDYIGSEFFANVAIKQPKGGKGNVRNEIVEAWSEEEAKKRADAINAAVNRKHASSGEGPTVTKALVRPPEVKTVVRPRQEASSVGEEQTPVRPAGGPLQFPK